MCSLREMLYSAAKKIAQSSGGVFGTSVQMQAAYLEEVGEATDLLDRSYKQYKCQRWLKKRSTNIITDLVSIPLILYYLFKKSEKVINKADSNVFLSFGIPDSIIPDAAKKEHGEILTVEHVGESIEREDRKIIYNLIKQYLFSPEFVLKCLIKTRTYKWAILSYNPKAIFVSEEYSYTSSYLTYYCHRHNIKHICMMHGEKLYYIRDSFFEFDRFYIWDKYYADLFIKLKATPEQFEVAIPPAIRLVGDYSINTDYTYYLANEDTNAVEKIIDCLKQLKIQGKKVRVRPHPRYTSSKAIGCVKNNGILIEDLSKVSIEESLLTTKNAISLYSTVLNQAVFNNIGTVIDDVSDVEKYKKLRELMYRFSDDKRLRRLSEIL